MTQDLIITTEEIMETMGGRTYPVTITRKVGLHEIMEDGVPVLVEASTTFDAGPKIGTTLVYTICPAVPYTEAEREAGRREIQRVAAEVAFGRRMRL